MHRAEPKPEPKLETEPEPRFEKGPRYLEECYYTKTAPTLLTYEEITPSKCMRDIIYKEDRGGR